MDKLEETNYFSTTVYAVKKPEFLKAVREVSHTYLQKSRARKKTAKPMTVMTANYANDPIVAEFAQYVSQTAWNILNAQGYEMDNLVTYFHEMWTHEHNYMSGLDSHFHGHGSQISAFYFIDVPTSGSKLIIHDPRDAKVITSLHPKNSKTLTAASPKAVFAPAEGTLMLFNAFVTHSFTRNMNKDKPLRFVHMNIGVAQAPQSLQEPKVEVI